MTDWSSAKADPVSDLLRARDEERARYRALTQQASTHPTNEESTPDV